MTNKCGVVKCKGNYNKANKCRVFKLPKDQKNQQKWIDSLPPRKNFVIKPSSFYICEKHWPSDTPMKKLPGGSSRPISPPSIFNVPSSCLPTSKPKPRTAKKEDRQLNYFLQKDKLTSLSAFSPEKDLNKKYDNLIISRDDNKLVCVFMRQDYQESELTIIVENKATLCSPLTLTAFKDGIRVPLSKILRPNNGLSSYSMFFDAVHAAKIFIVPVIDSITAVISKLENVEMEDNKQAQKMQFLIHQLKLHCDKHYSTQDYCFAVESYPHCSYEALREYLVLPNKRKVQAVISSINLDEVLEKTFQKISKPQQKNALLLVDEVKIRPTVAFSGGALSGMAANNSEERATSMLCVMLRCLHRGPSVMISVTPVHNLTAAYQFDVVKKAAICVEEAGGTVLGSITDNHKINQQYAKMFDRPADSRCPATAVHPLDNTRPWYLLFDTVHLLKCIRNNWLTGNQCFLQIGIYTVEPPL